MKRKNLGTTIKAADKAEAETNSNIITATFDMQKILTYPFGNVSISYYKRKLLLQVFSEIQKKLLLSYHCRAKFLFLIKVLDKE